jgi:hypothetical protein
MKGRVLDYGFQKSLGIISGEDGSRYTFLNTEWKSSDIHPAQGVLVDFSIDNTHAKMIYALDSIQNKIADTTIIQTQQISAASIASMIFGVLGFLSSW